MDLESLTRLLAALAMVLGLIAACVWAVKRFGLAPQFARKVQGEKRLAVVETMMLDTRRQLILVRRDGFEHLLLVGPSSELVVETGIPAATPTSAQTATSFSAIARRQSEANGHAAHEMSASSEPTHARSGLARFLEALAANVRGIKPVAGVAQ